MSGSLCIDIAIESSRWSAALANAEDLAKRAVDAVWHQAGRGADAAEVSVVLSDDAMIRKLNKQFRGRDKATNVLSFPADDDGPSDMPRLLGDIILAYDTIAREAVNQEKPIENHFQHLCVHGMLHLLDHDHRTDTEAKKMERLEVAILATMGIGDPYEIEIAAMTRQA